MIRPQISSKYELISEEFQLREAYFGKSKDKLDVIDLALPLDNAVVILGHFVKCVEHNKDKNTGEPLRSAFDIMMRLHEVDSTALSAHKPERTLNVISTMPYLLFLKIVKFSGIPQKFNIAEQLY